jgi:hypothetical protein
MHALKWQWKSLSYKADLVSQRDVLVQTLWTNVGLLSRDCMALYPRIETCQNHRYENFISYKLRGLSPVAGSELFLPSDRRLSEKLVPTFVDRGCRVVSATDLYGRNLGFLDRSRYFFYRVAPQIYSRGWVDLVPDPLLLRKCGSAGNPTQTSGSVARSCDH